MKIGHILSTIAITIGLVTAGLRMIFIAENKTANTIGYVLIVLGVAVPILILIYFYIKSFEKINSEYQQKLNDDLANYQTSLNTQLSDNSDSMSSLFTNLTTDLNDYKTDFSSDLNSNIDKLGHIIDNAGFENDSKFVEDGFIGLQRMANSIENDSKTGQEHVRMAVLGHLPSYMRTDNLSFDMGKKLYKYWEPPHLIPDYVNLINQRKDSFKNFIENGGIARDIFSKQAIEEYVKDGCTFHDNVEDPVEEIEHRLKTLLYYLDKDNYWICLLNEKKKTPNYLIKSQVGLIVDMRTSEINSHFTNSIDGLFSESKPILEEFERKFQRSWQSDEQSDKKEIGKFINHLLSKVEEFKDERNERAKSSS